MDAGSTVVDVTARTGRRAAHPRWPTTVAASPRDELPLALERHATSKIASLDDEQVGFMGFRGGEALAAIAAVSRMGITSRTRFPMPGASTPRELAPAALNHGTVIDVADLYFNTARRKFLKSRGTEFSALRRRLPARRPQPAGWPATQPQRPVNKAGYPPAPRARVRLLGATTSWPPYVRRNPACSRCMASSTGYSRSSRDASSST